MASLFELGKTVSTPAALQVMLKAGVHPHSLLDRHSQLDPGKLDADDQEQNREARNTGARIFSSYEVGKDVVWVITDATGEDGKRAVTTCLLPDEY